MADLRQHFSTLGFNSVETFIASGNVIFSFAGRASEAALATRIEAHLKGVLGYAVPTFLRTAAELAAIATHEPFAPAEMGTPEFTVHVGFLREKPHASLAAALAERSTPMDAFALHGRELYWLCRGKTTESLVKWPQVEKLIGVDLTMRNRTTIGKLMDKYPP